MSSFDGAQDDIWDNLLRIGEMWVRCGIVWVRYLVRWFHRPGLDRVLEFLSHRAMRTKFAIFILARNGDPDDVDHKSGNP